MIDKQARLNELKRIVYPSDQELTEMDMLQEELKLESNDKSNHFTGTEISLGECKIKAVPIIPKQSLLRKILRVPQKETVKPTTQDDITQLKLDAQKEELLARIAKARSQKKSYKGSIFKTISNIIGESKSNPFDMSGSTSKKKRSDYDPFRW